MGAWPRYENETRSLALYNLQRDNGGEVSRMTSILVIGSFITSKSSQAEETLTKIQ